MLIREASKRTGLTKKAIEYYTSQGLVSPAAAENGYREFSEQDLERLLRISVLRKLDVPTDEIARILKDPGRSALQSVSVRRELDRQSSAAKQAILERLAHGASYADVRSEVQAFACRKTVAGKLLDAFPGYYGRFICLHFARFLGEPIATDAQRAAYETVVSFLDNLPPLELPADLAEYLAQNTDSLSTEQIAQMLESTKKAYENPEAFWTDNKEMLDWYLAYKQSDAYRNSPAGRLAELLQAFNGASGYNDVFLPAIKQLSPSYAAYCRQAEVAGEKLGALDPRLKPSGEDKA